MVALGVQGVPHAGASPFGESGERSLPVDNPAWELLGIAPVRISPQEAVVEMPVERRHLQMAGRVHGGFIATLIDTAAGVAVIANTAPGTRHATIDLHVEYLHGATLDSKRLRATARVRRIGRTVAFLSVDVVDQTGELIAIGTASYHLMRPATAAPAPASDQAQAGAGTA
ncbi:MAG: PaaI family thioesterase [Bacillota bacterium]|nr:PaaI family thioesterase [Bacillota bacterium]